MAPRIERFEGIIDPPWGSGSVERWENFLQKLKDPKKFPQKDPMVRGEIKMAKEVIARYRKEDRMVARRLARVSVPATR